MLPALHGENPYTLYLFQLVLLALIVALRRQSSTLIRRSWQAQRTLCGHLDSSAPETARRLLSPGAGWRA